MCWNDNWPFHSLVLCCHPLTLSSGCCFHVLGCWHTVVDKAVMILTLYVRRSVSWGKALICWFTNLGELIPLTRQNSILLSLIRQNLVLSIRPLSQEAYQCEMFIYDYLYLPSTWLVFHLIMLVQPSCICFNAWLPFGAVVHEGRTWKLLISAACSIAPVLPWIGCSGSFQSLAGVSIKEWGYG